MLRIFRHYVPKSLLLLGTSEALILFGSVYMAVSVGLLGSNPTGKLLVGHIWTKAAAYALLMMLLMAAMGLYERGLRDEARGMLLRISLAFLIGLLAMTTALYALPAISIGSGAYTVSFLISAAGVIALRMFVQHFNLHRFFKRRIIVLGAGSMAAQLAALKRKSDWSDAHLVGFVALPGEDIAVDPDKVIAPRKSLLALAKEYGVHEIVCAIANRRSSFPINDVLDCKMNGIQIVELSTFFEKLTGKIQLDALSPSSILFADGFIQAVVKSYMHRGFDILLSLGLLFVTWPIMVVTALAIFMDSGGRGSILYRQTRVGRNGRNFRIVKFRSMRVDAEAGGKARWASANDSRVTGVGGFIRKTRIDELPQLLNVLRGDMSFVGPRPERPEFVRELAAELPYYDVRHRVNPGITGWAQVCYPYGASLEDSKEKLQYDLYYIKNYSLFLDFMILIQTAQVILWGKGAR